MQEFERLWHLAALLPSLLKSLLHQTYTVPSVTRLRADFHAHILCYPHLMSQTFFKDDNKTDTFFKKSE